MWNFWNRKILFVFTGNPSTELDLSQPSEIDLDIQHDMEYFPKVSSSTKRVPREYMTNTEKHGHSMEIQTLGSSPKPTYSPMPTQTYAPPNKNYDKPIHADRTPAYLESFVPLSSTPKPVKVDESAILLGLTPQVQNKIPDGYELVPLDKLTDEYEIVPWNEVQKV